MNHYDHLIIGGGMTADSAAHGIREIDPSASVIMISDERFPPYDRPPLSKKLWTGKSEDTIWRKTAEIDIDLCLDRKVVAIDPVRKTVTDNHGNQYGYGKLLIATGGTPRRLSHADEGVIYFRNLDDYHRLRDLCSQGNELVVIGGGFIGSEIAAALAINGKHVTMVFPGNGIGSRVYPANLVEFINAYYQNKGVVLVAGESSTNITRFDNRYCITTSSGRQLLADGVVAGIGIEPEISLAQSAGLELSNGIKVDEFLRTTNPDIYAAGDVASFYNPALDRRMRVEHEDNANIMGIAAGRNMAGWSEPYHHLPYFYSDLFELGYEAVGVLDSSMDVFEDWVEPYHKGVLYYLREGYVRGVLLWNVWGQVDSAREVIATNQRLTKEELVGRIKE